MFCRKRGEGFANKHSVCLGTSKLLSEICCFKVVTVCEWHYERRREGFAVRAKAETRTHSYAFDRFSA